MARASNLKFGLKSGFDSGSGFEPEFGIEGDIRRGIECGIEFKLGG